MYCIKEKGITMNCGYCFIDHVIRTYKYKQVQNNNQFKSTIYLHIIKKKEAHFNSRT